MAAALRWIPEYDLGAGPNHQPVSVRDHPRSQYLNIASEPSSGLAAALGTVESDKLPAENAHRCQWPESGAAVGVASVAIFATFFGINKGYHLTGQSPTVTLANTLTYGRTTWATALSSMAAAKRRIPRHQMGRGHSSARLAGQNVSRRKLHRRQRCFCFLHHHFHSANHGPKLEPETFIKAYSGNSDSIDGCHGGSRAGTSTVIASLLAD